MFLLPCIFFFGSEVILNLVPRKKKKKGRKNLCSRRDQVAKLFSARRDFEEGSVMVTYLFTD
jgi:hypothetical protein